MNDNIANNTAIHLYIPFKTHRTTSFRIKLSSDKFWCFENSLSTGFFLGYIDRIFNKDGIYSDCLIMKNESFDFKFKLSDTMLCIEKLRIFSFDTSVAFLELSIPVQSDNLEKTADIVSQLRLSNQKSIVLPNGMITEINYTVENILNKFGKITVFEHLGSSSETRPELFVSTVLDKEPDNVLLHSYRIANGLDSRYHGEFTDGEFYSNFSYIKWCVTDRGVCNIGIKTENKENCDFISNNWHSYTETRYIVWYILVLHQKYSMYQYMNDIADRSAFGNLREFQRKIMLFNTKYRFSIISEESSHQKLYEIMSKVKCLDDEFNDIDDEIIRISEYYESKNDKNNTKAMTIISILCAASAIKDFYGIISGENIFMGLSSSFNSLSAEGQMLFVIFITAIFSAMIILIPKTAIIQCLKRIWMFVIQIFLRNKTK